MWNPRCSPICRRSLLRHTYMHCTIPAPLMEALCDARACPGHLTRLHSKMCSSAVLCAWHGKKPNSPLLRQSPFWRSLALAAPKAGSNGIRPDRACGGVVGRQGRVAGRTAACPVTTVVWGADGARKLKTCCLACPIWTGARKRFHQCTQGSISAAAVWPTPGTRCWVDAFACTAAPPCWRCSIAAHQTRPFWLRHSASAVVLGAFGRVRARRPCAGDQIAGLSCLQNESENARAYTYRWSRATDPHHHAVEASTLWKGYG